jgi:hypothetical protein
MIESGWAASFSIYPSIPSYFDLVMLQEMERMPMIIIEALGPIQ